MNLSWIKNKTILSSFFILSFNLAIKAQDTIIEKQLIGKWCLVSSHIYTCGKETKYSNCEGYMVFDSLKKYQSNFRMKENDKAIWSVIKNNITIIVNAEVYEYKILELNNNNLKLEFVYGSLKDSNLTYKRTK